MNLDGYFEDINAANLVFKFNILDPISQVACKPIQKRTEIPDDYSLSKTGMFRLFICFTENYFSRLDAIY